MVTVSTRYACLPPSPAANVTLALSPNLQWTGRISTAPALIGPFNTSLVANTLSLSTGNSAMQVGWRPFAGTTYTFDCINSVKYWAHLDCKYCAFAVCTNCTYSGTLGNTTCEDGFAKTTCGAASIVWGATPFVVHSSVYGQVSMTLQSDKGEADVVVACEGPMDQLLITATEVDG